MTDLDAYGTAFSALQADIREYFIFQARTSGSVICPLYEWKSKFPLDNMIYHETMGRKAIHIELNENAFLNPPADSFHFFISKIGVDDEIAYLKIYLNCLPVAWHGLWRLRQLWFEHGTSDDDIAELAASLGEPGSGS